MADQTAQRGRGLWGAIRRTQDVDTLRAEADASGLRRTLGLGDLVLLGVGGVVGTGVFLLTGQAAAQHAGPAVSVAFLVSAVAAGLAGLCYAEMAAMLPVAGSAYTFAYATLGEGVAFIIGWNLLLEYGVAAAAVGTGWSAYVAALVRAATGRELPAALVTGPLAVDAASGALVATHATFNWLAAAILLAITAVVAYGVRLSLRLTAQVVAVKLAAIVLFILAAAPHVDVANWAPFVPPNAGTFGRFGVSGVFQAATMLFFAYCGFDAISTAAQESRQPQRDVPRAMVASLAIAAALYVAVALVLTGVVPYRALAVPSPLAVGIAATRQPWLTLAIDVGALAGLTSVLVVQIYGQTRILLAMARDGLLPPALARLHPRRQVPARLTWGVGIGCALAAGLLPLEVLGELTSSGTLFAFALVSLGVTVLRLRMPAAPRPFRVPGGPYLVPLASTAVATGLMATATPRTLVRLAAWTAVGVAVYLGYGVRHARARTTG